MRVWLLKQSFVRIMWLIRLWEQLNLNSASYSFRVKKKSSHQTKLLQNLSSESCITLIFLICNKKFTQIIFIRFASIIRLQCVCLHSLRSVLFFFWKKRKVENVRSFCKVHIKYACLFYCYWNFLVLLSNGYTK